MSARRSPGTVTLREVAAESGLSVSAVSLALSGHPSIPNATSARVRAAAERLGYVPNGAARALRSRQHQSIGLLIFEPRGTDDLSPPSFYTEAVMAVAAEALRHGYTLVLVDASAAARGGEPLDKVVARARIDGAVCLGPAVDVDGLQRLTRRDFPFIYIGKREAPGLRIPYVTSNYLEGARLATEHLLRLGHRRVAVAVDPGQPDVPFLRDRLAGHALAIEVAGLPPSAGPVLELPRGRAFERGTPEQEHAWGDHWDTRRWLREGITAIFAVQYPTAVQLLHILPQDGLHVPDDVAIVAFGDYPGAGLLVPPLTVVKQPLAALGTQAARTLLAWLAGAPRENVAVALQPDLVIRQSCGALLRGARLNDPLESADPMARVGEESHA